MIDRKQLLDADREVQKRLEMAKRIRKPNRQGEQDVIRKITDYILKRKNAEASEYLVRGATLICSKGSHKRKINLPKCHGVYIHSFPVLHELECRTQANCGLDKCNITHFGICEAKPPTEKKTYMKTFMNSKDGSIGVVTGCGCEPVIVGTWQGCYDKVRIVDNGLKNPADRERAKKGMQAEGQKTLTMESFLVCKYGGIIEPVKSGQRFW